MFDIYDYFDSPDIAAHCRALGRAFGTAESAALISASWISAPEKRAAYRLIIDELPDEPIDAPDGGEAPTSVHALLAELIRREECCMRYVQETDPSGASRWSFTIDDKSVNSREEHFGYEDFEAAIDAMQQKMRGAPEPDRCILHIKKYAPDGERRVYCLANRLGEPQEVDSCVGCDDPFPLAAALEDYPLRLPLPFKKGDILRNGLFDDSSAPEAFCVVTEDVKGEVCVQLLDDGFKLIAGDNGELFGEFADYPLLLKYCEGALPPEREVLRHLSRFLKGRIGLPEFLEVRDALAAEYRLKSCRGYKRTLEERQHREIMDNTSWRCASCPAPRGDIAACRGAHIRCGGCRDFPAVPAKTDGSEWSERHGGSFYVVGGRVWELYEGDESAKRDFLREPFNGWHCFELEEDGGMDDISHRELWDGWLRGELDDVHDYDYWPRGRVVLREWYGGDTDVICLDRCIDGAMTSEVARTFWLDRGYTVVRDESYRCHNCMNTAPQGSPDQPR